MEKPTLSAEDQEIFDRCVKEGLTLQLVNGSAELRDALATHYGLDEDPNEDPNEDPTAGGEFILAVNGNRSVRDRLTGYIPKD